MQSFGPFSTDFVEMCSVKLSTADFNINYFGTSWHIALDGKNVRKIRIGIIHSILDTTLKHFQNAIL